MFVPLTKQEEETQKHLWNVAQGQRLAASAARSASCGIVLEGERALF